MRLASLTTVLFALLFALAIPATAKELTKASIVLQWVPQSQFAGFYMAQAKGFYTAAGLDLTIIPGGPNVLASELLETGQAEFATMFLSSALHRRQTIPIVNVGQFVQHSSLMLIAMKDSGIEKIEDLGSQKVGLWANEFQVQARLLFLRKKIQTTVIPQSDSLDLFMRRGVAAASGMWYNEYHTLLSYGMEESELKPFFFRDLGLDFPEDGIYCLEKTAQTRPDVCKALTDATARGWEYAFQHKEETLDVILTQMRKARVPANRAHQRWMLNRMADIIYSDDMPAFGVLRQADYQRVKNSLLEADFIKSAPLFSEFYRGPIR